MINKRLRVICFIDASFQMEMQVTSLRSQMEKSNTKSEGMQQTLEDLQRKLTVKESELTEAGKFKNYLLTLDHYLNRFE